MIYYFSGTGNSRMVASLLAKHLNDETSPMTSPTCGSDTEVGLVFPVYAWGIPQVVEHFVEEHVVELLTEACHFFVVMTCGDDMGYADKVLEKRLLRAGARMPDATFSVQMPNTYVCLPGFDVDTPQVVKDKLSSMKNRIPDISIQIRNHERGKWLTRGAMPWLKTYVVRPLFNRLLLTDRYLHVTPRQCIGCGTCAKICPINNINMKDKVPQWTGHCVGCLACFHQCPQHAIEFGRMTQSKGQYKLPEY